jgi:hypothetical protein
MYLVAYIVFTSSATVLSVLSSRACLLLTSRPDKKHRMSPLRDHRISVLDARTVFVVAQGIMSPGGGQLGDPSGSPRNGREQRAPSSSSERLREGVMAERVV